MKNIEPVVIPYYKNLEKAPYIPGNVYGQDIEPSGEYVSFDEMSNSGDSLKLPNFEYGVIKFKKPLFVEYKNTGDTGWKKDLSDKYNGLTGRKLSKAIIKDGDMYSEIVNLAGAKLEQIKDMEANVTIYFSESSLLKKGDVYSLDEANVLFEKADMEANRLKKVGLRNNEVVPRYEKIRALVELPEGHAFGFRYDSGDSNVKNLVEILKEKFLDSQMNTNSLDNLKKYLDNVLYIGDIIIDKNNKYNFIADIKNENYECFEVANKTKEPGITDINIESGKKVLKADFLTKINKSDIKFRAAHIEKTQIDNILQRVDLFKQKGLVQVQNTSAKITHQVQQNNTLEL